MNHKAVISHITNWLTAYCNSAKMDGFVVGISGGIDSAVTSTLCARTGKKVLVLNMPILQLKEQDALAREHIEWLKKNYNNVSSQEIDLTDAFKTMKNNLPQNVNTHALTMGNTRSRLRMITLYAFAGANKLLVAGTGNKVEDFGVGFFTKHGDGAVDLSPIADLMKSDVYAIAKKMAVLDAILAAPPTDGLWEDKRTDHDQIGATYDELEWAMKHSPPSAEGGTGDVSPRQKQVLEIYNRYNTTNAHKMKPIPVCVIPEELKRVER